MMINDSVKLEQTGSKVGKEENLEHLHSLTDVRLEGRRGGQKEYSSLEIYIYSSSSIRAARSLYRWKHRSGF